MSLTALLRPVRTAAGALRATVRTLGTLPDVVDAVLVLPQLSRQLHEVQLATATLPAVLSALERMRYDTSVLPDVKLELAGISRSLSEVEQNTQPVTQLAEIALPLTGAAQRVGRLADRLPARNRTPGAPVPR